MEKVAFLYNSQVIKIKVSEQKLYFFRDGRVFKVYPISTSKFGVGNKFGSNKTPLGMHRIASKIGRNARLGAIFMKRRNTGRIYKGRDYEDSDLITTRILRLEGLDNRVNKGEGVDSFQRCIYIHGTTHESSIGKPASHGCIRMKNSDIIELFDFAKRRDLVYILK